MEFIAELHQPELAFLPIGDHFTMGPREAAIACRLVKPKTVIPMHYGTFPVLAGRPEELAALTGRSARSLAARDRKARTLVM